MDLVLQEALYVSSTTRVLAAEDLETGRSVALKLPAGDEPSEQRLAKIRHEYAMLCQVQGPGVIRTLGITPRGPSLALVLERWEGEALDSVLSRGPLPLDRTMKLGAKLARALGQVHRQAIIHRDVKPHNVLVDTAQEDVRLIDFGIAVQRSIYVSKVAAPDALAGTPAYMSPEQTGRMNRSVDTRADLYSLGVTLYLMLAGVLPFETDDLADLIYAHSARHPMPAHERAPERSIPRVVSAIVTKLLAKSPDARYQTAEGVAYDLEQATALLAESGVVNDFELATHDWEDRIRKPSRLFGREKESAVLEHALSRVARGAVEVVLVAGPSGVGKSALVQDLRGDAEKRRYLFASGKFDRLQRSTPHLAFSQALRSIVRRRLADSAEQLSRWKEIWRGAAGSNGRILVDLIPELALILGEQAPMADVGPMEAKNRFVYTLRRFVQVTASMEHPLLLFIDDLQWADGSSIELIQDVAGDPELKHCLIVGTYRDDEVPPDHPIHAICATIESNHRAAQTITLVPLGVTGVESMVSDLLQRPPEEIRPLAEVTKLKTDGSPFFVEQFLRVSHEQGLLRRDRESGAWCWELSKIDRAGATENVLSLLTQRTRRLSTMAQHFLSVAACAGSTFEWESIWRVADQREEACRAALAELLLEGLVQPAEREQEAYEFVHDRVQQTAYELLGKADRTKVHHALAKALDQASEGVLNDNTRFAVLHHYLQAMDLIVGGDETRHVAELCLQCGCGATAESTYIEAVRFLRAGQKLLGPDAWNVEHSLTFETHISLAEALWLSGQVESGEVYFRECWEKSANDFLRTRVATLWIMLLTVSGRFEEASELGLARARELGYAFPAESADFQAFLAPQLDRIVPRLKALEGSTTLSQCTDPVAAAEAKLLARLGIAVGVGKTEALPIVAFAVTEHALTHGVSRATAVGCGVSAMISVTLLVDLDLASDLVRLGRCYLGDAQGMTAYATHSLCIAEQYLTPLYNLSKQWKLGREMGRREGDLPFGAYCSYMGYFAELLSGHAPFGTPPKQIAAADFTACQMERVLSGLQLALTGGSVSHALSAAEAWCSETPPVPFFFQFAHTSASILALHVGEIKASLDYALTVSDQFDAAAAHPQAIAHTFAVCIGAQLHPGASTVGKAERDRERTRLEKWAACTPENFLHMKLLVDACEAWSQARHDEAVELFHAAISQAHQSGFTNDEALGLRLLGEHYTERGQPSLARAFLRDAASTYLHWGAKTCANAIYDRYPQLVAAPRITSVVPVGSLTLSSTRGGRHESMVGAFDLHLDAATVLRATQALAGDMVLGSLVGRVLRLLSTNAGAQRGVLVLARGEQLFVEAEISMEPERLLLALNEDAENSGRIPGKVVAYVGRSKQPLLLGQVSADTRFTDDPYLVGHRPASILAVPLIHQGRITGVMYLEHAQVADAFPLERVELVSLLAAQAATAVENATLYNEVEKKTVALQVFNEQLERQIEERTTELRAAKEAADRANQAKSIFLSSMSHELRTPLNGILGYAQVLECASDLPGRARDEVAIIKKSGDYLLQLINDVLDVAKIEAGKMDLVPRDVSLIHLMKNVASLCRVRAEQKGIAFDLDVPAEAAPLVICADEKRLMQVLLNLASNAIKFTEEGAVQFSVETRPGADATVHLLFRVRDSGPGIAQENLARIFQPFEQVGDQDARSKGTGLGLAITNNIVECMGGRIEVQSAIGRGSTFMVSLELPLGSHARASDVVGQDEICGYQGAQRRVLVVDDNGDNRSVIRALLAPIGFEVFEAHNGEQALAMAGEHRPELFLIDMMMPGMSGCEVIRKLRALPGFDKAVIVASSASISKEVAKKSVSAGANDFLPKPVERNVLLAKIASHLDLVWMRREPEASHQSSESITSKQAQAVTLRRPPAHDVARLRQLVEEGRMHAIVPELARLEKQNTEFSPWVAQVRELVVSFQIKALRGYLGVETSPQP